MSHTFYIYDSDRCKVSSGWVHPSANLIQVMSVRMAELEQKPLGRSPRLARLAHRLLQHFSLTERYRALVELCRTSVQPVGSGVA